MKSLDAPDFIEASWKAHVLIGALADKYAASGLTRIKQFDAVLLRSDGAEQPIGSGLGNVVGGQIFLEITHDLRDEIIENAENAGLTDVHVRTLRGIQEALLISATASDPSADITRLRQPPGVLTSILGRPAGKCEGVYLELRDARGEVV